MAKPIKSPADLVKHVRVTDQHGRKWGVIVEKETFDAAGPFSPIGWNAPWYPPSKYMRLNADSPHLVFIDYEAMVQDYKAEHQTYDLQLRQLGMKQHGQAYKPGDPPTQEVLDIIGPRPFPWEIAEAARRGDKWILGATDVLNEKLSALLPVRRSRGEDLEFDESLLGEVVRPRTQRQLVGVGGNP